jgi:hypothetical protein
VTVEKGVCSVCGGPTNSLSQKTCISCSRHKAGCKGGRVRKASPSVQALTFRQRPYRETVTETPNIRHRREDAILGPVLETLKQTITDAKATYANAGHFDIHALPGKLGGHEDLKEFRAVPRFSPTEPGWRLYLRYHCKGGSAWTETPFNVSSTLTRAKDSEAANG